MKGKGFRNLNDIFNDPEIDEILEPLKPKSKVVSFDPDIRNFQELTKWVKDNGREPQKVQGLSKERTLYSRLKGYRKRPDKFRDYDELGLLVQEESNVYDKLEEEIKKDTNSTAPTSLDDILNDNSVLFEGLDNFATAQPKLFETKSVTKKREIKSMPDTIAKRRKIKDFSEYEVMFKRVQKELAAGKRELRKFKNYDISLHRFYVLKGQLIYIESFGEDIDKNNANGSYKDRRVHVIYENGTESNLLYRGLGANLYGRGGKVVTEPIDENAVLTNDDYLTGYIYVLKSLSENPKISRIKSLYKIGFTSGSIKKRIANAENESTYLYAPVKLVEQIQVINLDAQALETAIHHALAKYQLDVEIQGPNGKMITPREWFVVDLPKIEEIVNRIITRLQSEQ